MNKKLDEKYFSSTPLFKEYKILDLISKEPNLTQREISKILDISVSMVNDYLEKYTSLGYLSKEQITIKNVKYTITKKGIERKKVLNIGYLKEAQDSYINAKNNILEFLNDLKKKKFNNIILYGAGEVAEIMLRTIYDNRDIGINVLAILDDSEIKVGNRLVHTNVISPKELDQYEYDGILISSYGGMEEIFKKLKKMNIEKNKIIKFF